MIFLFAKEIFLVKSEMLNCSDLCDVYNNSDVHVSIFEHAKENKTFLINFDTILHMIAYEHSVRKHFLCRVVTVFCYIDKNCIFLSFPLNAF